MFCHADLSYCGLGENVTFYLKVTAEAPGNRVWHKNSADLVYLVFGLRSISDWRGIGY